MSKYTPFRRHLFSLQNAEALLSFADIETILGCALPPSARAYRTWWANHGGNMVHQMAWVHAGWRVDDVDLTRERVRFRRFKFSGTTPMSRPTTPMARADEAADRAVKQASLKAVEKASKPLTVGVRVMTWRLVGLAERRGDAFVVTGVPPGPGIVRFHVLDDGYHEIFVAAVLDMPAFVAAVGYQPAGTAKRSGQELTMAAQLAQANEIVVDCATADQVFIMVDGGSRKANFADDAIRSLLAAAVEIDGHALIMPRLSETG